MRPPVPRSRVAGIAALTLAGGLAACGGGTGGSSAISPASTTNAATGSAGSASPQFALGLMRAAPAELARMTQIRHVLSTTPLPTAVDLSASMPPVGNQGSEGSCVSWASAYALRGYEARKDVWSSIAPKSTDAAHNFSAAFVYNQINGGHDAGSTIPAALSLLETKGAATLADMPYVAGQYTTQPSAAATADALHYKLSSYGYIAPTDLTSMKTELAAGIPVILAISVYYNFFSLGQNQIYSTVSGAYQGGHAITAVGYDDTKGAVEIINSWGPTWGTAGYGWISYTTLKQIALEAYSAIDDHGAPVVNPTPTPTPKVSPTATPTATPTPKVSPTATPTATPTPKVSATPSTTSTAKPSATPTPTK